MFHYLQSLSLQKFTLSKWDCLYIALTFTFYIFSFKRKLLRNEHVISYHGIVYYNVGYYNIGLVQVISMYIALIRGKLLLTPQRLLWNNNGRDRAFLIVQIKLYMLHDRATAGTIFKVFCMT